MNQIYSSTFLPEISIIRCVNIVAPEVPESGKRLMPQVDNWIEGFQLILHDVIPLLIPDLQTAAQICVALISCVVLVSLMRSFSAKVNRIAVISAVVVIIGALMRTTNALIGLGTRTITDMTEYGKLLLPVLTAALAAQGGIGKSAALYSATMIFLILLSKLIQKVFMPGVYIYLASSISAAVSEEPLLKRMKEFIKNGTVWCLKTIMTIFVTYVSITGVISGTTDAAMLKTTKTVISSAVPIVGGILSDASEAVLVSAAMAKNAAGIYGLLAILAVFLTPFLKLLCNYLLVKITAFICTIFDCKNLNDLIEDFSGAMALLLAMTGCVCLMILIGTVCYLKGVE